MRKQPIHRQTPGLVERDVFGDIELGHMATQIRAHEGALLGHELRRGHRQAHVRMRQAGGDRLAALAGGREGELQGWLYASEFRGHVHAAVRPFLDLVEGVLVLGIDGGGGAQLARTLELVIVDIGGDHLRRAAGNRTQYGRQAHAAEADYEYGLAQT